MEYNTLAPHPDLASLVKLYWTLEIPAAPDHEKQRILPDGCVDMIFILGDDVKRFTNEEEFILQPRAMILGQINQPFFIKPAGFVKTFAARFFPYGFAAVTSLPLHELTNKETALSQIFGKKAADKLCHEIINAPDTAARVGIVDNFLLDLLKDQSVIDGILKSSVDAILSARGIGSINALLKDRPSKRRQLERNFSRQVGLSPKQLCRAIRLQSVLQLIAAAGPGSLTSIAYETEYFDQAHLTNDFKELVGVSPKEFFENNELVLSALMFTKK